MVPSASLEAVEFPARQRIPPDVAEEMLFGHFGSFDRLALDIMTDERHLPLHVRVISNEFYHDGNHFFGRMPSKRSGGTQYRFYHF